MIDTKLPPEVLATLREFRTCEFTTMAKNGTPITWPLAARYEPEHDYFIITTSIGFPQKAFNIRRNTNVSLLFSDPTASGLNAPATVLVQADATVANEVTTTMERLENYWRETIFARQPSGKLYSSNALLRWMMDWYYMRLVIRARPRTITWWQAGRMETIERSVEYVA